MSCFQVQSRKLAKIASNFPLAYLTSGKVRNCQNSSLKEDTKFCDFIQKYDHSLFGDINTKFLIGSLFRIWKNGQ